MSEARVEDPAGRPHPHRARANKPWRFGTPVVILLCGALFVISAQNSDGTDLRPGRYTDLASLVQAETNDYDALRARVNELNQDIAELSESVADRGVRQARAKAESFRDPAGLVPRTGPGVRVTMSDAPEDVQASSDQPPNLLVVHQQDLQSVVNAMWAGGATAITIQGERVISTTGINCEGNAVLLQGRTYPQPYVIEAIGDPGALAGSLEEDPDVSGYRQDAADPDIAIGWDFAVSERLEASAYDGLLDLSYAEPLG